MAERVGFLGLGIMGRGMAANLVRGGHEVCVWNRTSERCADLVGMGATELAKPRDVVEACGITLAMVSDPQAARAVCFGEDGVLQGMAPGKAYVDCSTVDPATVCRVDEAVRGAGGRFLEAPVSGSRKPAEDGTLVILAAGEQALYDEALPLFDLLGKRSFYLGEVGNGARMKLAVNLVMGIMMEALAEGLELTRSGGLEPTALLEVLSEGAVANPMFQLKGPAMVRGEYPTAFPLKHMRKDLRLALALAVDCGLVLPAAEAADGAFQRALEQGLGDADFSAVMAATAQT